MMRIVTLVMLGAAAGGAQTTINGGRDFMGTLRAAGAASAVDFRTAGSTAPARTGTLAARPSACTQGDVYFTTDGTAGQNLSFCTATGNPGTWSAMSGGSGSAGAGVSYCAPSGGSGSAYTCSPSPQVTLYALGTTLAFVPDVNAAGGATTLNVSGLGAKSVKAADGTTNPASTDLAAGRMYLLTYDGAVFRIEHAGGSGGTGGSGGSAAGSDGAMQYNSSGSFAGQQFALGGGIRQQRGVECSTGTVNYTSLTANAVTQEISILTSVSAKFRYHHVLVQEATQFAGTPNLQVGMGTSGVGTDLLLPLTLKQSTAPQNYSYETPRPPAVGTGTYNLVLQFTGSAALGNGTTSSFTAGAVNWEVCGFSVQ